MTGQRYCDAGICEAREGEKDTRWSAQNIRSIVDSHDAEDKRLRIKAVTSWTGRRGGSYLERRGEEQKGRRLAKGRDGVARSEVQLDSRAQHSIV